MPITVIPASHDARSYPEVLPASSQLNLARNACPKECSKNTEILVSSFEELQKEDNIVASSGSFLRGTIQAWARHLHLVLRPEDIWFAILVQLNFYMSANAEKLRHLFVNHEGKERIELATEEMNAENLKELLGQFSTALHHRIKTEWMFDWIMPNFSTTTPDDEMTANVLMMGMLQSYFHYHAFECCGIPSITLLGDREDWVKLLRKLHRLSEFGAEPTDFAARLKPILTRFVHTFDEPRSEETRAFWNRIIRADPQNGSGQPPYNVSGWLTGFCYWTARGEPEFNQPLRLVGTGRLRMELDSVVYPIVDITDVPVGYAKAPVRVSHWPSHRGTEFSADKGGFPGVVIAGALGKRISPGVPKRYEAAQPASLDETVSVHSKGSTSRVSCLACLCIRFSESWGRKLHKVDKQRRKPKVESLERKPIVEPDQKQKKNKAETSPDPGFGVVPLHEQGTLQPVSGWILLGPEQEDHGSRFDHDFLGWVGHPSFVCDAHTPKFVSAFSDCQINDKLTRSAFLTQRLPKYTIAQILIRIEYTETILKIYNNLGFARSQALGQIGNRSLGGVSHAKLGCPRSL
jgi:hypothetical protein